jgi:hypothetical protein
MVGWRVMLFLALVTVTTGAAERVSLVAPTSGNAPLNLTAGENAPVQLGEKLTYTVAWHGFPLAVVRARAWPRAFAFQGRTAALLELAIETTEVVNVFYPVTTILRSYVDLECGAALFLTRRTTENDYRAHDQVSFDYTNHDARGQHEPVAVISEFSGDLLARRETNKIPGLVIDPVALAWRLRGENWQADHISNLVVADRYGTRTLFFHCEKRETIVLSNRKKMSAWRLSITPSTYMDDAVRVDKLWLDTATGTLLRAVIFLPLGEITVDLHGVENSRVAF